MIKIKEVINSGIRMAFRNYNLCISAAQEEMNIMPIEEFGRYMQVKNIIGANGNSIFKSLMDNYKTKSVGTKMKKTVLSKLKQYIDKNNLAITNREELKEEIK